MSRYILNKDHNLSHMLIPLAHWHIVPDHVKKAINYHTDGYGSYRGPTGKTLAVGHNKGLGYFLLTRESDDAKLAQIIWSDWDSPESDIPVVKSRNRWENG